MTYGVQMRGALAVLLVVLSGCTATANPDTAAIQSTTQPSSTLTTSSLPASSRPDLPDPIIPDRTPNAATSSSALIIRDCAASAARAIAAAASLLPEGTSRTPEDSGLCSAGQPLDVTFPAVAKLAWTVTVKVTAGPVADCQAEAANGSASCQVIVGHPGFSGAEVVCSAIACDQAWVSKGAELAVVLGYVLGAQLAMSQQAIPAFNGLGTTIGVSVLTALGG
ncbi:hypothetical protein ABIB25_004929 [Nakamurella sp. UYEF19]|uniref:hypothetical protein n=1 Tax=Nakamurella sp. UYEF19 TaxID=1756392 RepID=UPI0033984A91